MQAREFFEAVARATRRMRQIDLELSFGRPRREGSGHAGPADPTASAAMANEALLAERARCERAVGLGLERCEQLRAVMGGKADAVELRFVGIDGEPLAWQRVGEELGVTRQTAAEWCAACLDWIDAHGWAHLAAGTGSAQD